jgi:ABC-2 type transport system permease protein
VELLPGGDGTNGGAYRTTRPAMTGAVAAYGATLAGASGESAAITLSPVRYDRSKRIHDAIASQFGFLLCIAILMVAAMGLAREREMGTLEQLLVTPLNRFELLLGKTMPALLVGGVDFWMLWLAGRLIWGMPMRGSLLLLVGMAALFILAESAWGLFLSAQAADQQQATQFILLQVMVELSFCGYLVPVDNLPLALRWFSELLPLRHYLDSVRTIVLRGGDLSDVAGSLIALLILNAAFWFISSRALRRRLS